MTASERADAAPEHDRGLLLELHELLPGRSDDGAGALVPLVFGHPVSFHAHVWFPVARRLSYGGRQVAFDLPGHGSRRVHPEQPVDWHSLAELVWSTIEAADLTGCVGIGHSMGAALMTIAEIHHPGTFSALWLYEPVIPRTRELPAELQASSSEPPRTRRATFDSIDDAYASYRAKRAMELVDDESLRLYVDHGFDVSDDGTATLRCAPEVADALAAGWTEHRIYDRVAELTCPVHLVHGDRSGFQAGWTRDLHEVIPGSSLEECPELHHLGPLEQPARIARSIDDALARLHPG